MPLLSLTLSYSIVQDLYFEGIPGATLVTNSSEVRLENLYIRTPTGANAVYCGNTGNNASNVYALRISNVVVGFNSDAVGTAVNNTTNSFFADAGCYTITISNTSISGGSPTSPSGNHCLVVEDDAQFIVLNDFECDHSRNGIRIDGGRVIQSVNGFYGSSLVGNGITFTENFIGNAQFANNDVRGNQQHGILINGGRDFSFVGGVIGNNSQASCGSYHGVTIGQGVELFSIVGTRNGQIKQQSGNSLPVVKQGYGVFIVDPQTADFVISNNNFVGNRSGGVNLCADSTNKSNCSSSARNTIIDGNIWAAPATICSPSS